MENPAAPCQARPDFFVSQKVGLFAEYIFRLIHRHRLRPFKRAFHLMILSAFGSVMDSLHNFKRVQGHISIGPVHPSRINCRAHIRKAKDTAVFVITKRGWYFPPRGCFFPRQGAWEVVPVGFVVPPEENREG